MGGPPAHSEEPAKFAKDPGGKRPMNVVAAAYTKYEVFPRGGNSPASPARGWAGLFVFLRRRPCSRPYRGLAPFSAPCTLG